MGDEANLWVIRAYVSVEDNEDGQFDVLFVGGG